MDKQLINKFKKGKDLKNSLEAINNLTFKEILIFLKSTRSFHKNDRYHIEKQFAIWNSELVVSHFKQLMESDLKEDILFSFFSTPKHFNPSFFKLLITNKPDLFIKFSKLSKSFLNDEFYSLYKSYLSRNQNIKLKTIFKEFDFFYKKNLDLEIKKNNLLKTLKHVSIEDILIQTCSLLEIEKRTNFEHIENSSYLVQFRVSIVEILNCILSEKIKSQNKERYSSVQQFNSKLKKELPPINPAKSAIKNIYSPHVKISNQKYKVILSIQELFHHVSFRNSLDKYSSNLLDFESINDNTAVLIQNNECIKHRINMKKYNYSDIYFENKEVDNQQAHNEYNITKRALNYWKDLRLPYTHKDISIKKSLLILHTFSSWIIPKKRNILYNDEELMVLHYSKIITPKEFEEIFYRNYMHAYSFEDLCKKISTYFNWDFSEVEKIVNFLSTDILNFSENKEIDLCSNPFIRIGNQIFWMTNLFEDFKWEIHLHKRIVKENICHNKQTTEQEKDLCNCFINANFNSVSNHKYKLVSDSGTISGEIDTLAYKNKHLFVIEMKTTYVDEEVNTKAINHSKTIEGKAKYQLNNGIKYIRNNFKDIKDIKKLNIDCELSDIKIIPLIVSNIFDYEGQILENGTYRISYLTLKIILNNDLSDMMFTNNEYSKYLNLDPNMFNSLKNIHFGNTCNPNLNLDNYKFPNSEKECNLWKNPKECSPNDIIDAIKQNKVWEFVNKIWNFKYETIKIS